MILKKLTITCFAILLPGQVIAHAPNITPDEVIFISGSSVQDLAIAVLVENICIPGTLDIFKDNSDPANKGGLYTSYFCTLDSAQVANLSANKKVLINKRSAGGVIMGLQAVANAVNIEALNINNNNCNNNGDNTWDCDISGGVNGNDLVMRVSDAGISDVEPTMYTGINVPPGSGPITPSELLKLQTTSMNAVIYGVPITTKLYRALQVIQGLNPALDDEANMPSLSSEQVGSLITGGTSKWNQLLVDGAPLTLYPGITPPTNDVFGAFGDVGPLVHICRRTPGSGTQVQMNAIFANAPCAVGVLPPSSASSSNPITGPLVQENTSSNDLTTCLSNKDAANKWAIGVQSLAKTSENYRFVKIDGYAPTLKNVAENKYKDWAETTMQWRWPQYTGPVGDVLAILQKISKDASSPSTMAALNSNFVHGFGTGAFLSLNTNGYLPSYPHDDNNPVTTATHAPFGTPNTCNFPHVNINSTF